MKKRFLLLAPIIAMGISTAFSQITIGPKLGMNISNVKVKEIKDDPTFSTGGTEKYSSLVGYQLGAVVNVPLNENLSLRPELLYSREGFKYEYKETFVFDAFNEFDFKANMVCKLNYFTLPVNFVIQIPVSENIKLQPYAGPYASILMGGKATIEENSSGRPESVEKKIKTGKEPSNTEDFYFNSLDFGFNLGLGLQIESFLITANYKLGLSNIEPHYIDSSDENTRGEYMKMSNRGFNFSVAYFLGAKK